MTDNPHLKSLIHNFQHQPPLRAGSFIITFFGDAIAERGGTVWLGSIINLLQHVGINDRLVRTAVSRLAKDNWIEPQQIGRKSYYSLTKSGIIQFKNATPHIYTSPHLNWNQTWTTATISDSLKEKETKDFIKKELNWMGFGKINNNSLIHPSPDIKQLDKLIERHKLHDQLIIMKESKDSFLNTTERRKFTRNCWDFSDLKSRYSGFIKLTKPILTALNHNAHFTPLESMLTRLLLIHEYRKLSLRDPHLPQELMESDWVGHQAHHLCKAIYIPLLQKSEQYIDDNMLALNDINLPSPTELFHARFGGLS